MTIPLAPLTRRLRQDTGEKRVGLVRQNGKLKVRGSLSNGQNIFRDLRAADELTALDNAVDMVKRLQSGKDPSARMPPTGHLKRCMRDAMEKLEQKRVRGRPLRPQTLRAYARRMAVIGAGLPTELRPSTLPTCSWLSLMPAMTRTARRPSLLRVTWPMRLG